MSVAERQQNLCHDFAEHRTPKMWIADAATPGRTTETPGCRGVVTGQVLLAVQKGALPLLDSPSETIGRFTFDMR